MNLVKAQTSRDTIYFSDSLNQAIVFHGIGLNITQPELWITYDLGINNNSDTIAFARDSAFIVTYNGWEPRISCRHFADDKGQSVYCIKAAMPKDDFLYSRGFSNETINSVHLDEPTFQISNRHVDTIEADCEYPHLVLRGNLVANIEWNTEEVNLSKTNFSYDISNHRDTLSIDNQAIIKDIHRTQNPIVYFTNKLEFIVASYGYKDFEGVMSSRDELGNCHSTFGHSDRLVKAKILRKK